MSSETSLGVLFESAAAVCPELRRFAYPHDLPASLRFQDGEWHWWRAGVLINNCPPAHRDAHIDSAVLNWAEKFPEHRVVVYKRPEYHVAAWHEPGMIPTCYTGPTRQHALLSLMLTASPAKAEANPEAGTEPPEGQGT